MSKRRVAVTGMGLISPVGNTVAEAWDNVVAGNSGIGPIESMDVSNFATTFAGQIRNFDPADYLDAKSIRRLDPFIHYGVAASKQAYADAGIDDNVPRGRIGVALGSGIGGINFIESNYTAYIKAGSPRRISPFFIPGSIINMAAGVVSMDLNLTGPNIAVVSACTTAAHNIGLAARTIAYGDADVMLAGGAEMATSVLGLGGFISAKALSSRNDAPQEASRPWDKDRDGFVLSDGAGMLVLEEWEHARKRGAHIHAELLGFGMSGDAHHMTAPLETGDGAAASMRNALRDAGVDAGGVGYVNAHATSTPLGDHAEITAMKQVLAGHHPLVSSTKSTTGHLLGAAGAAEAIFSILALRDQVAPPTINLHESNVDSPFDLVPLTAREASFDVAMSNSFGFGGTNGTLVFGRPS